jgi:hypothetical protein
MLEDVAILFGTAQSQSLYEQCVLEVFYNTNVNERQTLWWSDTLTFFKVDPQTRS